MAVEITKRQKELLETEAIAVATINQDGSPNLITVVFAKVVTPSIIIITDNFMRNTPENIKRDSRICVAVWAKDWKKKAEGYKFIGKAEHQTEGKWAQYVKEMKENQGYPAKAAIIVEVENIFKLGK
ncbi:MAG: pyridoxamine 5'-phosphate oxidase family protein [Candidatus Levyibacteriota bacterium]